MNESDLTGEDSLIQGADFALEFEYLESDGRRLT